MNLGLLKVEEMWDKQSGKCTDINAGEITPAKEFIRKFVEFSQ
jgi:hypothetical protein